MASWDTRMGDGSVHADRGDLDKARKAYDDALSAAENDLQRSRALAGRGVARDRAGDAGGRDDLEEALRLAEAADPEQLPLRRHDAGLARLRSGRLEEAIVVLEAAWRGLSEPNRRLPTLEVLGQACLDAGRDRSAESVFLQLLATAQQAQRPDVAIRAQNGRGEALRRLERPDEAKQCFQKVVEVLGPVKQPNAEQCEQAGVALHNLGVLFLAARPDVSGQMLDQAVQCFVDAFGTAVHPHVARSKAFLGKLELDAGRTTQASSLFDEALRLVDPDHPVARELVPTLRGAPPA